MANPLTNSVRCKNITQTAFQTAKAGIASLRPNNWWETGLLTAIAAGTGFIALTSGPVVAAASGVSGLVGYAVSRPEEPKGKASPKPDPIPAKQPPIPEPAIPDDEESDEELFAGEYDDIVLPIATPKASPSAADVETIVPPTEDVEAPVAVPESTPVPVIVEPKRFRTPMGADPLKQLIPFDQVKVEKTTLQPRPSSFFETSEDGCLQKTVGDTDFITGALKKESDQRNILQQQSPATSAQTCLAMLLLDNKSALKDYRCVKEGTYLDADGLKALVEDSGNSFSLFPNYGLKSNLFLPAMVEINHPVLGKHWVIVDGVDLESTWIKIRDPYHGISFVMNYETFMKWEPGELVLIRKPVSEPKPVSVSKAVEPIDLTKIKFPCQMWVTNPVDKINTFQVTVEAIEQGNVVYRKSTYQLKTRIDLFMKLNPRLVNETENPAVPPKTGTAPNTEIVITPPSGPAVSAEKAVPIVAKPEPVITPPPGSTEAVSPTVTAAKQEPVITPPPGPSVAPKTGTAVNPTQSGPALSAPSPQPYTGPKVKLPAQKVVSGPAVLPGKSAAAAVAAATLPNAVPSASGSLSKPVSHFPVSGPAVGVTSSPAATVPVVHPILNFYQKHESFKYPVRVLDAKGKESKVEMTLDEIREEIDGGRIYEGAGDWGEYQHHYIPLLFPTDEPSPVTPDAPYFNFTQGDGVALAEFRNSPLLKAQMRQSLKTMMDFYGFDYDPSQPDGKIVQGKLFAGLRKKWLTPGNHNFRRIARILKSLRLAGLETEALKLWTCLEVLHKTDADAKKVFDAQGTYATFWLPEALLSKKAIDSRIAKGPSITTGKPEAADHKGAPAGPSVRLPVPPLPGRPPGIPNQGNSCFGAAATHFIGAIPLLHREIVAHLQDGKLKTVLQQYPKDKASGVSVSGIKINDIRQAFPAGFGGGYSQQDAHELMVGIINNLQGKDSPAVVQKTQKYVSKCIGTEEEIESIKVTREVPLLQVHLKYDAQGKLMPLEDLLEENYFVRDARGDEPYVAKGSWYQKQSEENSFETAPEVLLINIVRQEAVIIDHRTVMRKNKTTGIPEPTKIPVASLRAIHEPIAVPETYQLSKLATDNEEEAEYELVAVIRQTGNIGGGHYKAYVKNETGYWTCDDSRVTPCKNFVAEAGQGYLLGYVKKH